VTLAKERRETLEKQLSKPVILAECNDQTCEAAMVIQHDPQIISLVSLCLGCPAKRFVHRMFWSFPCQASDKERLKARGPKPLNFIFSSPNQSEEAIVAHYGHAAIETLCGPAGYGFLEDHFCYHRVLPPKDGERLML
jgi:hypothetical protein